MVSQKLTSLHLTSLIKRKNSRQNSWKLDSQLLEMDAVQQKRHCTKMKFSIKDFFSKCDQILSFVGIWSHLLRKSLMKNFIFCAVRRQRCPFSLPFYTVIHQFLWSSEGEQIPILTLIVPPDIQIWYPQLLTVIKEPNQMRC